MSRLYDSDVLRAYQRRRAFAAQRAYAKLPPAAQRRYAAAHPAFVSTFGNIVPEHLRFQMADAADLHGPEAADALWLRYQAAQAEAATQAQLAAARMPFGERLLMALLYLLPFLALALVALPTAAYAFGRHGATATGLALTLTYAVCATYRLLSGVR